MWEAGEKAFRGTFKACIVSIAVLLISSFKIMFKPWLPENSGGQRTFINIQILN
jgi:hypothetical protein